MSFAANASYTRSCTSSRFAHTHVCPVLRYFDAIAPSTAASRSASSNTMNGALPPSSSDTFFTVPAHCAISDLPTSVEPVNDSFRTVGFDVSSAPMSAADPVTTLNTPLGTPARSASSASASAENGVCDAGFSTTVQPARDRRPGLPRDHRERKIPRRDARHDADRLLDDDDAFVGLMAGNRVAVDALGFLAEPFQKRRRVASPRRAALASGLPCSVVIRRARSSWLAIINSYQRRRTAARSFAVFFRHAGNARAAASIASRVSMPLRRGTVPMTAPVAGSSTGIVAPERAPTHAPSM